MIRPLGRGAAGGVFLVEDRIAGGAPIALKRLHAKADDLLRASFEREFVALASLSLPGVSRVLDFGLESTESGAPFFTRTYVEGVPLDEASAKLDPADRIRLIARVAEVVEPLHRMGMVHGDVKPANVIVQPSSLGPGQPHVIDFGLARLPHDRTRGESSGTPPYMAPEIVQGDGPSVRGDVYALGATLWTVLTGEPPFARLGPRALAAKIAGELPEIPRDADPLTRAALAVALRAMAPDAMERLPAVHELRVALAEVVGDASARVQSNPGFVAPRPRGHEEVLADLEARAAAALAGGESGRGAIVISSARGGGRSTLLRELKWRLQLRGTKVVEAAVRGGDALAPIAALLRQASVFAGPDPVRDTTADALAEGRRVEDARIADALARGLSVLGGGPAGAAVLVDDLDLAEEMLAAALRMAMYAEGAERVAVIVTAADTAAPAIKALGPSIEVAVPELGKADVAALVADALGAVDATVVDALHHRSAGLPASLVDALRALSTRDAPTAADVAALPAGEAATAVARARLGAAPAPSRPLLEALAVADGALPQAFAESVFGPAACAAVEAAGLGARRGADLVLDDRAIADEIRAELDENRRLELAKRLHGAPAAAALPLALRAQLALAAGDDDAIRDLVPAAARERSAVGAARAAAKLWEALRARTSGPAGRTAALELADARNAANLYDDGLCAARTVLDDVAASNEERVRAAVIAGRALVTLGRYDEAVEVLEGAPADAEPAVRALPLRELARLHLRRGDYPAVLAAADAGLALAPPDDPVRIELLTASALAASYRGERELARRRLDEALAVARRAGSRRDEGNVHTYRAIDHHRAGEFASARDLYGQAMEIARELGDVAGMASNALNLGTVCHELRDMARAAEHYEAAARLARRAGRVATDVLARNNLATLHGWLGLYERARIGAEGAKRDAEARGLKLAAAQAVNILGDVAARTGDLERALARYDEAVRRFRELGQRREIALASLDAAEALLDRGGPVDASAAAARLAEARTIVDGDRLEDFRTRLRLLLARARGTTGDPDGAAADLETVLHEVREAHDRDLEWQALAAAARMHAALGAEVLARKYEQRAAEILEAMAIALPREHREAFWQDPRRREVRRRVAMATEQDTVNVRGALASATASVHGAGAGRSVDARAQRLLEIIKRLASEHDLDRLLERITDAAVELSGAERGLVLLTDESGGLETRTVRDRTTAEADPHVSFSRSIAEAVLIDGEPIVTVDATHDRRLSEYMSVHKLMLRSVACLPIRGRSGTVGVLYLEHRARRGRFGEDDVDLLFAFADQAAIALENARLIAENERRRRELEQANVELERANDEIERLLVARTAELEEARRELGRAREELRGQYDRHGIVGRSEAMRRVFALLDRVREASVPVVVQGESGTGKELVARAIHYGGPRAKKPFVALNCAAVPEPLLESELFGHVRGAFTGADRDRRGVIAQASGGTLFLDEVGDMPAKMQIDLLRVLQDGRVRPVGGEKDEPVDVRIIAASNKSLRDLVAQGRFREDLYYRLNVVEILLPPLRDRVDDVPILCDHFLAGFAKRDQVPGKRISRDALRRLAAHPFPGNVRQLEHVLLNAWVLTEGEVIDVGDLALGEESMARSLRPAEVGAADEDDLGTEEDELESDPGEVGPAPAQSFEEFKTGERQKILAALEAHAWNRVRAAKALGIPRRTFYRRLKEHGIL